MIYDKKLAELKITNNTPTKVHMYNSLNHAHNEDYFFWNGTQ
jgi:hypothetical protein